MAGIKNKTTALAAVLTVLIFLVFMAVSFLIIAALTYLICMGFGFEWSWTRSLGVWAVFTLLRWIVSAAKPSKN